MSNVKEAQPTTTITFSLLRHGQTEWNRQKRIQGQSDSALTDEGIRQLRQWKAYCEQSGFRHILASDLGRVRQSVSILNEEMQLPVTYDKRLREQDWGKWAGMESALLRQNPSKELEQQISRGWNFTPPGGESRKQVLQRAMEALDQLSASGSGTNILVVCHLGVIKCLIYALLDRQFLPHEPKLLKKHRLYRLTRSNGHYAIDTLNICPVPKA